MPHVQLSPGPTGAWVGPRDIIPFTKTVIYFDEVVPDSDKESSAEELDNDVEDFGLDASPGSLMRYLRIRKDTFIRSVERLGQNFIPLVRKYSGILQQLEKENNLVLCAVKIADDWVLDERQKGLECSLKLHTLIVEKRQLLIDVESH